MGEHSLCKRAVTGSYPVASITSYATPSRARKDSMHTTFELNGKRYTTDNSTLEVLRSIVPCAKRTGDPSAVQVVLDLGLKCGRIRLA